MFNRASCILVKKIGSVCARIGSLLALVCFVFVVALSVAQKSIGRGRMMSVSKSVLRHPDMALTRANNPIPSSA
jgi:hypothetical protein